jgi:hypothetical protein
MDGDYETHGGDFYEDRGRVSCGYTTYVAEVDPLARRLPFLIIWL